jgi:hypothetical protein
MSEIKLGQYIPAAWLHLRAGCTANLALKHYFFDMYMTMSISVPMSMSMSMFVFIEMNMYIDMDANRNRNMKTYKHIKAH